jgi:hypothetical protein
MASMTKLSSRRDTFPDFQRALNAAIDTILTCYEERLRDLSSRIRAIHIDHVVRTISSERSSLRQIHTES